METPFFPSRNLAVLREQSPSERSLSSEEDFPNHDGGQEDWILQQLAEIDCVIFDEDASISSTTLDIQLLEECKRWREKFAALKQLEKSRPPTLEGKNTISSHKCSRGINSTYSRDTKTEELLQGVTLSDTRSMLAHVSHRKTSPTSSDRRLPHLPESTIASVSFVTGFTTPSDRHEFPNNTMKAIGTSKPRILPVLPPLNRLSFSTSTSSSSSCSFTSTSHSSDSLSVLTSTISHNEIPAPKKASNHISSRTAKKVSMDKKRLLTTTSREKQSSSRESSFPDPPAILSINQLLTKDAADFSSPVNRNDVTIGIQAEDSISTTPFLIDRNKIFDHQIEARDKVERKQQQLNVLPRVKGIKHENVS